MVRKVLDMDTQYGEEPRLVCISVRAGLGPGPGIAAIVCVSASVPTPGARLASASGRVSTVVASGCPRLLSD